MPRGTTAVRPPLRRDDYLLLEEVLGPSTGAAADADPTHRQVVRILNVDPGSLDEHDLARRPTGCTTGCSSPTSTR